MQALRPELRHEPQRARLADAAVQLCARETRIEQHAGADEPGPVRPVGVEREHERQPVDEVGRDDVHQCPPLLVRLAHEPNVAHLEVAQTAVNQLRRGARRRAGEVAAVDECDIEPVRARRLGDSRADDSAADHEQIEPAGAELLDRVRPIHGHPIHSAFVQAFVPSGAATSIRPYGCRKGRSSRTAVISPAGSRSRISPLFG